MTTAASCPFSIAVCCRSDWGVPACSIKDVGTVTEQACTWSLRVVVVCMPRRHAIGQTSCGLLSGFNDVWLQVAGEMASAGLQRMMEGYEREKSCSDLAEPKGFICLSTTGFAGGAPRPEWSGMQHLRFNAISMATFLVHVPVSPLAACRNVLSWAGNE